MSYAEGLLSGPAAAEMEKHLEECASCRGFLNEIRGVLRVIEKEKEVQENPFFFTRVEARMLRPVQVPAILLRRLVPTMVAIIFFAGGVFAGINIGRLYGKESGEMLVYETKQYIDDLGQEPIESFIINLYSDSNDTK